MTRAVKGGSVVAARRAMPPPKPSVAERYMPAHPRAVARRRRVRAARRAAARFADRPLTGRGRSRARFGRASPVPRASEDDTDVPTSSVLAYGIRVIIFFFFVMSSYVLFEVCARKRSFCCCAPLSENAPRAAPPAG